MGTESRYAPDMTKATAGVLQLPKGDYELKVGDVKTFKRTSTDPNTQENKDVFGLQYSLTVTKADTDEKFVGKTIPLQLYFHTPNTEGINKRFAMAVLGFPINEEDAFNQKYADADWGFDVDEGSVGEFWKSIVGGMVGATADIVPDKRDVTRKNQQFNWRPI